MSAYRAPAEMPADQTPGRLVVGATSDGLVTLQMQTIASGYIPVIATLYPEHVRWLIKELIKHMPDDAPPPSPSNGDETK